MATKKMKITIKKRPGKREGLGTGWTEGTVGPYRFQALVFPEHADNEDWELGRSRISKLWVGYGNSTIFEWDRGLSKAAEMVVEHQAVNLLKDNLARLVFGVAKAKAGGKRRSGGGDAFDTFDQLRIGAIFKFVDELKFANVAKGPWVKLSARTYRHIEGDWSPVVRVGSIHVRVIQLPGYSGASDGGKRRKAASKKPGLPPVGNHREFKGPPGWKIAWVIQVGVNGRERNWYAIRKSDGWNSAPKKTRAAALSMVKRMSGHVAKRGAVVKKSSGAISAGALHTVIADINRLVK